MVDSSLEEAQEQAGVLNLPPVVIDTAVLDKFQPWSGTVPAGYFAYFLGNVARAHYWAFSPEVRSVYGKERYETYSKPPLDDNALDWLAMLEAVADSTDCFTMVALGAGWGRWLVAGALAAKQKNRPFRLVGLEAEPTHFQWMLEHFRDNGIDPDEHELIEAAAAGQCGEAWFYVGNPAAWYGQSIIPDGDVQAAPVETEIEHNGAKATRVRTLDIRKILKNHERVDYLHMDIQGAEYDLLSKDPGLLDRKVKRVLIGTHSHEIEENLRALFGRLGWHCQYDIPMNGKAVIDGALVEVGDGSQLWVNPAPRAGKSKAHHPWLSRIRSLGSRLQGS